MSHHSWEWGRGRTRTHLPTGWICSRRICHHQCGTRRTETIPMRSNTTSTQPHNCQKWPHVAALAPCNLQPHCSFTHPQPSAARPRPGTPMPRRQLPPLRTSLMHAQHAALTPCSQQFLCVLSLHLFTPHQPPVVAYVLPIPLDMQSHVFQFAPVPALPIALSPQHQPPNQPPLSLLLHPTTPHQTERQLRSLHIECAAHMAQLSGYLQGLAAGATCVVVAELSRGTVHLNVPIDPCLSMGLAKTISPAPLPVACRLPICADHHGQQTRVIDQISAGFEGLHVCVPGA
jgi:hypothetical protein